MNKLTLVALVGLAVVVGVGCQKRTGRGVASSKAVKGLESVHFDYDQSVIKGEYKDALEKNKKYLEENASLKVTVEGHCDERGSEEYNIALGHRRAKSTKDYLVSLGVAASRLGTKSFGEEKPLESCHNESCWWKNRRAEFVK
ncbi:MAG: peptidoglycan-associated lipoprotein Pal [Deltaproteobacteria bacterium]|nr:peptidoglycan-associated lipoprotein Pal [Deltaproteobacteria bacterium]MBI2500705.1 peptidoglycan-associated lipoprotein Pal [Deltaproteobacteria bacterium]MBI4196201.1 peptidoglycan-associated lipoprotein Pal [Deltaproteobacteria bacterium]